MTRQLRDRLFELHPDTNGGDTSKVGELIQVLKGRPKNRFCIEVGNKVQVGGFWWRVIKREPKSMFVCQRKIREHGSMGSMIKFTFHQNDFTDMRCGRDFAFRMIHI